MNLCANVHLQALTGAPERQREKECSGRTPVAPAPASPPSRRLSTFSCRPAAVVATTIDTIELNVLLAGTVEASAAAAAVAATSYALVHTHTARPLAQGVRILSAEAPGEDANFPPSDRVTEEGEEGKEEKEIVYT